MKRHFYWIQEGKYHVKTYIAKDKDIQKNWLIVDATDKILGRLASKVASILRGKDKVIFSPHQDTGDEVIVINASKIKVTGNKLTTKEYKRYSSYPGGLNTETMEAVMKKNPGYVIRHAVKGMLPKNKLADKLLKKLRVYPNDVHPHAAQKPKELKLT
jgi:large subunit ribosomal protein L13